MDKKWIFLHIWKHCMRAVLRDWLSILVSYSTFAVVYFLDEELPWHAEAWQTDYGCYFAKQCFRNILCRFVNAVYCMSLFVCLYFQSARLCFQNIDVWFPWKGVKKMQSSENCWKLLNHSYSKAWLRCCGMWELRIMLILIGSMMEICS